MAFSANTSSVKKEKYTVAGATLAEIWADIQKKGPKSHGKNVAALTETACTVPPNDVKWSGKVKENKKAPPEETWEASLAMTAMKAKIVSTIKWPNLKSAKDLSKKAKKEWDRFVKELDTHEKEHIAAAKAEMKKIHDEIAAKAFEAKAASKEEAVEATRAEAKALFEADYTKAKIDARIEAAHKALDAKSGHGPTLDTSIP